MVGVITYRVLPSWQALTGDVGADGAWVVAILFHVIYGTSIGVGNIISFISQKQGRVTLILFVAASSITVILLNTMLSIFMPVFGNIIVFCLLLAVCSFVISSALFLVAKMHNKSLNQTGANDAPPG